MVGLRRGDIKPGDFVDDDVTGLRGFVVGVAKKAGGIVLWLLRQERIQRHVWDDQAGIKPPPNSDGSDPPSQR